MYDSDGDLPRSVLSAAAILLSLATMAFLSALR